MRYLLTFLIVAATAAFSQNLPNPSYDFQPLIGSASRADGKPAASTLLNGAYGTAEDSSGNVYISESKAGVIRKVRPDGIIERFAGTGVLGYTPEGRSALESDLTRPTVLLADRDGGLLFYESAYCQIRKVQTDGAIADVAGTGRCASSGSSTGSRDRKALETSLSGVGGMVLDSQGRLLYSDPSRNIVRRLDSDGIIRTIAGTGTSGSTGDSSSATLATLNSPQGLAYDSAGNLYISDGSNCKVRKVDTSGIIKTVLGASRCATTPSGFTGGANAVLSPVGALALDSASNVLFVSLPTVYRVVRFDLNSSRLTAFLGNGKFGVDQSTQPLEFPLNAATSIVPSTRLGVLVASDASYQVYQVQNNVVQRFAGGWPHAPASEPATGVELLQPGGLLVASDGSLLLTDSGAGFLMRQSAPDTLTTVAGMPYPFGFATGDGGTALQATLYQPYRVVQGTGGNLYITSPSNIRSVDSSGNINTIRSALSFPTGMAIDSQGRLFYSETGLHRVMRYDFDGKTSTLVAGTGTAGFSGDGGDATEAKLNAPGDLAFDSSGNLLIADIGNHRIRRVKTDGKIETIAGNGLPLAYRDITGLQATETGLGILQGMTVDANDNIYISESVRIDSISKDGTIRVVTGFLGEDDDGTRSYLNGPLNGAGSIAVDSAGRIYISIWHDGRVWVASPRAAQ